MPLPPALAARLAKRGIIGESKASIDENAENQTEAGTASASENRQPDSQLPPGWRQVIDKGSGDRYYWNTDTNVTSWERPKQGDPTPPKPPPQVEKHSGDKRTFHETVAKIETKEKEEPIDHALQARIKALKEGTATKLPKVMPSKDPTGRGASRGASFDGLVQPGAHETCWKCGRKRPLQTGLCARCTQQMNAKQGIKQVPIQPLPRLRFPPPQMQGPFLGHPQQSGLHQWRPAPPYPVGGHGAPPRMPLPFQPPRLDIPKNYRPPPPKNV
eukprot:m.58963 g.58963  ORF g.58963 m.58963 type:complete len:272 (-) comp11208_c0_seq1:189-1004(-)